MLIDVIVETVSSCFSLYFKCNGNRKTKNTFFFCRKTDYTNRRFVGSAIAASTIAFFFFFFVFTLTFFFSIVCVSLCLFLLFSVSFPHRSNGRNTLFGSPIGFFFFLSSSLSFSLSHYLSHSLSHAQTHIHSLTHLQLHSNNK